MNRAFNAGFEANTKVVVAGSGRREGVQNEGGTLGGAGVARRHERLLHELEILQLVGAGRAFVATPYLLEGVIEGVVGGLLALGVLALGFRAARALLGGGLELLL